MTSLWVLLDRWLIHGSLDRRTARLNWFLPHEISPVEQDARESAQKKIEEIAKLAIAGNFGAIATLAGLWHWLKIGERAALCAPAFYFAVAGVLSASFILVSAVEPVFKSRVRSRLFVEENPSYEDLAHYFWSQQDVLD